MQNSTALTGIIINREESNLSECAIQHVVLLYDICYWLDLLKRQ